MNGLKLDPGCRCACVTWLNLLRSKSKPPTRARIAPSAGCIEMNAASTCGTATSPASLVLPRQADHGAAPDAGSAAALSPSERPRTEPLAGDHAGSPSAITALTSAGVASTTTAATRLSYSRGLLEDPFEDALLLAASTGSVT